MGTLLGKSIWAITILVLSGITASCGNNAAPSPGPAEERTADTEAIRELLASNEAATNRRDADGVAATFLPDAELWIAGGARFVGLAEIRQNEEEFYRTPGLRNWSVTVEAVRFLTPNVALVESSSTTNLDSGETHSRGSIVVVRSDAGWRIAAVHVMGALQE